MPKLKSRLLNLGIHLRRDRGLLKGEAEAVESEDQGGFVVVSLLKWEH